MHARTRLLATLAACLKGRHLSSVGDTGGGCAHFASLPGDPWKRPWRLHLTVENLRDGFPPLTIPWKVTKRCATVATPVGPIKPPYQLRY